MEYSPISLLCVVRARFVFSLMMETSAPGIAPPEESEIRPDNLAVDVCATTFAVKTNTSNSDTGNRFTSASSGFVRKAQVWVCRVKSG
jgi:hypothetical protein